MKREARQRAAGGAGFDAAIEGARYGVPAELAREIWQRVCDAQDAHGGWYDERSARARFAELAARLARGAHAPGAVPGKQTLVEAMLRPGGSVAANVPGRRTLAEALPPTELGAARSADEVDPGMPRGAVGVERSLGDVDPAPARFEIGAARSDGDGDPGLPRFEIGAARSDGDGDPGMLRFALGASRDAVSPSRAGGAVATELPYRGELERSFGRSLAHVQAFTGASRELAPHGAHALATGTVVAFADRAPSPSLVAHEVAHVVQNEQAGASAPLAAGGVAPGDSAAEAEAETVAGIVAMYGAGTPLPALGAKPSAHVHLSTDAAGVPTPRLDKSKDAARLRSLIATRSQRPIVELLAQNAIPEHMYALHRAYGSSLVADVQRALTEQAYIARARVYLGEQLALDTKIQWRVEGDSEAIFGDLEHLPDALALALVAGEPVAIPAGSVTWIPATTTLAAVKDALRSRLPADGYARAMRLLLDKAQRAIAAEAAQLPAGPALDGFTVRLEDLGPERAHGSPLALSPVSRARVDVAEERIRAADAAGDWLADPMRGRLAALALAELSRPERQALALRLGDRPLRNAIGGVSLAMTAIERDDATVIRKVILDVQTLAGVQARASRGVGLELAMERAGELVQAARARLAALPPGAPDAERARAQAEVQRLEAMFFGQGSPVLAMARLTTQRAGDADGGVAAVGAQLRALGADPVTIAAEQLRAVPAGDGPMLLGTLRKVAANDRIAALQRAGLFDALASGAVALTADQREQMSALVWQAAPPLQAGGPVAGGPGAPGAHGLQGDAPIVVPPLLAPPLLGPRPELVLALHDVLDAMDRHAVHEVLGRLARMPDADQHAIYADPRFRQKLAALPEGHERSAAGHFKESLRIAQRSGAQAALQGYPTDIDSEHAVHVEALGAQIEGAGPGAQADLRRAYVLVERLGGPQRVRTQPALLGSLPPADREAVRQLVLGSDGAGLLGKRDRLARDDDKETANQLIFGQPDLGGASSGARDPASEAEFMYDRLREAARIRDGVSIADWLSTAGPSADESVTEFMVLYQRTHGAPSRGDLAQLADLYHRALRRLDSYRAAADSLAGSAAQIVGATVATIVVTVASGGTLGPVAIGAMATLGGAASSAATGAMIRVHSTLSSVMKDAGTGAVQGLTAAAGASLTARIVRGATMGLPAGRAAAALGARAVGQTSHAGAEIAAAIIDGALNSASGELFQTATDEATWDRGVGEAFAAMLAAVARAAATGAAMAGALGVGTQVAGKLRGALGRAGDGAASSEVGGAVARDHAHATAHAQQHEASARPHDGSAHDGSAHDGSAHDSSAHDGSAHDGSAHDGNAHDGSAHDGSAHDEHAPASDLAPDAAASDSALDLQANHTPAPSGQGRGKMSTGAARGVEPTSESIRQGTVRMEDHPEFSRVLDDLKNKGYEFVCDSKQSPKVRIVETMTPDGKSLRIDKYVIANPQMRWIDLEHELGHVDQIASMKQPMVTDRVLPSGREYKGPNRGGFLTTQLDSITEYHNRLVEYFRLSERGVDPMVLEEHANGVRDWRGKYLEKGVKNGASRTARAFIDANLADLDELDARWLKESAR